MAFTGILFGSHNFMVTALSSCVKWPLEFRDQIRSFERRCNLSHVYDLEFYVRDKPTIVSSGPNHAQLQICGP